jgi:protein-S-isoprenylcysteine O-methyltransferase Ste14
LVIAGILLPAIAITHFRLAGTQVMPTSEKNDKLVTNGLFALTRNPMYLGLTIASLGAALWFGRPLMLLAPLFVFAIANWVFIPFEEAKMRRQFGDQFDAYCGRVRRWL